MSQKPFGTLDLSGDYIVHDVSLYAHNHPTEPDGINAAVKSIETALKAFDLDDYALGGAGDMPKATYDTDNDGIVDAAERLNDGVNTVSAADLRDHLDNHPAGDAVGGYVEISGGRTLLASELAGHLIIAAGFVSGMALSLPDTSTLPDNARCDIVIASAGWITLRPYDNGKSGADNILIPGALLNDGVWLQSSGTIGDCISLRKGPNGWIAVQSTGFSQYVGE